MGGGGDWLNVNGCVYVFFTYFFCNTVVPFIYLFTYFASFGNAVKLSKKIFKAHIDNYDDDSNGTDGDKDNDRRKS